MGGDAVFASADALEKLAKQPAKFTKLLNRN